MAVAAARTADAAALAVAAVVAAVAGAVADGTDTNAVVVAAADA